MCTPLRAGCANIMDMTKKDTSKSKKAKAPKLPRKYAEILAHTKNNEIEILNSTQAYCLFCRDHFSAREIYDWAMDDEGNNNAICPKCGMDAIVGDASGFSFNHDELREVNMAIYGEDYMFHHPQAAITYCDRYERGAITHNKKNQSLYLEYLYFLSEQQNNKTAAFALGDFYLYGSEFNEPDLHSAFSYFANGRFKNDPEALTKLGVIALSGNLFPNAGEAAYQLFTKAMALGGRKAAMYIIDLYTRGIYVEKDLDYVFDCLASNFSASYNRFAISCGADPGVFPEITYRLGRLFLGLDGMEKSEPTIALRMFLYSRFGYELLDDISPLKGDDRKYYEEVLQHIAKLAKRYNLEPGEPVYDNNTFADSIEIDNYGLLGPNRHMNMKIISFDEEEGTLSFEMTYDFPPLILDLGNLFAGFCDHRIIWTLTDVESYEFNPGSFIFDIRGNEKDGWEFLSLGEGNDNLVARILFRKKRKKKKMEISAGGDA